MMAPMRRSPVSALSLLAVVPLAGCSLIPGSSSDLEDALEVVPADATTITDEDSLVDAQDFEKVVGVVDDAELEQMTEMLGPEDLARPEADAKARAAWLEGGGALARTRERFAEEVTWDVETDGALVRTAVQIALVGDGFTLCAP
jgi:hypothetical protein